MRRIDLDYAARRPRAGPLLFGAGLAAAVSVVVVHAGLSQRVERLERALRLDRPVAHRALPRGDPQERLLVAARVTDANEAIARLSMPWGDLLASVEDAASGAVALTAVQPQPQQHAVMLSGQARSYEDVLEYMGRLDASPSLSHARLLNHKVQVEGARYPVAFAIEATWRTQP